MNRKDIKEIRTQLSIGLLEAKTLLEINGTVEAAIAAWKLEQERLAEIEKNRKYQEFKDWAYYREIFMDYFPEKELSEKLKPLSQNYATKLWNQYVSEKHRHLMLVKKQEWKIEKVASFKEAWCWEDSWNEGDQNAFAKHVKHRLDWQAAEEVFFFWGRGDGVQLSWKSLMDYWIPFLVEDEMNIVINPVSQLALIIGVNGSIAIGKRN